MNFSPAEFFINDERRRDYQDAMKARLLVHTSLLTSLFSSSYLVLSYLMEFDYGLYLMMFNVGAFLFLPFLIKVDMPTLWVGNLYVGAGAFAVVFIVFYSGGVASPVVPWLVLIPAISLLLLDRFSSIFWTGLATTMLGYFCYVELQDIPFPVTYNTEWTSIFWVISLGGLMLIVFVINLTFERNRGSAVVGLGEKNRELESTLEQLTIAQKAMTEINQDISDKNVRLREQKERIAYQSEHLQRLNDQKDYIIDILAHDLRAPLNSTLGLIEVMENQELQDDQTEVVRLMRVSSEKAQNLINKVLDVGALEERKITPDYTDVDLTALIKEVAEESQEAADAKKIIIDARLDNHVSIETDRLYTRQIFENLMSNALKFSPAKSQVTIRQTNLKKTVRIEIQDQGPGLSKEDQEKLFSKFSRLSARPTAGEASTGLGLSLVKRFAELLGGKVWCESELGKGATFIVELQKTK